MISAILPAGLLLLWPLAGCSRPSDSNHAAAEHSPVDPTPSPDPRTNQVTHLEHAQPKLRTLTLYLGRKEITAEIAASRTEISTGLMFRKSMGPDEGMLFVFTMAHQTAFYMKNTLLPLSVAYINPDGEILEINDLEPLNEKPVPAQTDQIQFVLEMNRGWFRTNQIGVGTLIITPHGSLRQTFFPPRF